jgi:sec-independent protein translocase protein TatB
MFSVSPAEMVTIAVVALLVFGPHRLPEIARKLGKLGREVSRAANELKAGIEREYDEATEPLKDVRRKLGSSADTPADKPVSRRRDPSGDPIDPDEVDAPEADE